MISLLRNAPRLARALAAGARTAALGAAVFLAGTALVLAAGEGGHGEAHGNPWMDLVYKGINVAILLILIYWAARKPVAAMLGNLAKTTREGFLASRKSAQELEAQMAEQKQKITALAGDLQRMVAEAKADVEREKQRAQADAQAQAAKVQAQAQQQIEQEVAKARAALRQELAEQTMKLAEDLIKQRVNPEEQKRLVTAYLKQLEANA